MHEVSGKRLDRSVLHERCKRSLTTYKRVIFPRYEHAPHLEIIDRALMEVERFVATKGREGIGRLIIELPPRHGKTLTTSRLFPSWFLGRHPDKRVMLVSYGATLAHRNSRIARNYLRLKRWQSIFPTVKLSSDSAAVDSWDIAEDEGGCDAMGIDGGATGKGAHVLIIDDPVKNRKEAESDKQRENVWEAYANDLYTRLEPGGAIILMMTRWHQDDLAGRVLKQSETADETDEVEHWHRIRMPAIAEDDDDPLGRQPGEALWPWRYPVDRLKKIAKAVGRYVWAALFQQRPQPREGGLFKWADIDEHRVTRPPAFKRVVVAVDPSGSAGGDEVGIVSAAEGIDGHFYILADRSLHAGPDSWARVAVNEYHKRHADRLVAENNYGGDMVEKVIRTVDQLISYHPVTATRGKELRAEPIAALYEQHIVHHVGEFMQLEDELTTWKPGGKSPNRLDALVWVLTELSQGRRGGGNL